MFEVIIIDLGTYYGRVTMKLLEVSDVFLLVTEPALSCCTTPPLPGYASQRNQALAEKILVVINRIHDRAPYSIADMEQAIGRPSTGAAQRLPERRHGQGDRPAVVVGAPKSRLAGAIASWPNRSLPLPGSGTRKRGRFGLRLFKRG
jgi:MinD-like ATPase involved in chromosome partitioning or flagellar assembly